MVCAHVGANATGGYNYNATADNYDYWYVLVVSMIGLAAFLACMRV